MRDGATCRNIITDIPNYIHIFSFLIGTTIHQLRKGGFNLRLILGDKEEEQGAMQCGTSISNVTRLYFSLQLNGAKKKKQFVGIRFVQLAFLRKMLGTTK